MKSFLCCHRWVASVHLVERLEFIVVFSLTCCIRDTFQPSRVCVPLHSMIWDVSFAFKKWETYSTHQRRFNSRAHPRPHVELAAACLVDHRAVQCVLSASSRNIQLLSALFVFNDGIWACSWIKLSWQLPWLLDAVHSVRSARTKDYGNTACFGQNVHFSNDDVLFDDI